MVHYFVSVVGGTKSLGWVLVKQASNDVFHLLAHGNVVSWLGEDNLALPDESAENVVILVHEGWSACPHLVDEHSKGPPVNREAMT